MLSLTSVLMPCMKYTIHLYATALHSLVAVRPIVVCKPHYKLHSFSYRIIKTLPHGKLPNGRDLQKGNVYGNSDSLSNILYDLPPSSSSLGGKNPPSLLTTITVHMGIYGFGN